jgi:hypothetical protein
MQLPDTSSIDFLHKEWPVISAAPYSFCICVGILTFIGWGIIWWLHKGRIERYKESIEHLERDKERLKEQLAEKLTTAVTDVSPSRASVSTQNSGKIEVNPTFYNSPPPSAPRPSAPPPRKRSLNISGKKARFVWLSEGGAGVFHEPEEKERLSAKAIIAEFRNEPEEFSVLTWYDVQASIFYYDENNNEVAEAGKASWLEQISPKINLPKFEVRKLIVAIQARDNWIAFDGSDTLKLTQAIRRAEIILHDEREFSRRYSLPIDLSIEAIGQLDPIRQQP